MEHFDLIVIGGGGAAREAVSRARLAHGASVAVVNKGAWGGICGSTACKPTKQLLVAAELLGDLRAAGADLGIRTGPIGFSLETLKARKDWLIGTPDRWRSRWESLGVTLVDGEGSLVDARTVRAGDRLLTAPRILIATGSRTAVPPIAGLGDVPWLDHVAALELTEVPSSLLVLGAGAVGLELAQIFSRFGSAVTVVQADDRIAPRSDADASDALQAALEAEGIRFALATLVTAVRQAGDDVVATLAPRDGAEPYELRASQLLLAAGRAPNVEGLELEQVGVETTRAGIVTDDRMQTSVPGIWAVGDVVASPQLTPVGAEEGQIAGDAMFGVGDRRAPDLTYVPTSIFTDPEIASVGLTEDGARAAGFDAAAATVPASSLMRSYYALRRDAAPHGLVKLVYERGTRRILGLHAVVRGGGEIVQGWSVAIRLGATVDDVASSVYTFPTSGEAVHYAAEAALEDERRASDAALDRTIA
jgi:mercuric reductase